MTPNALQKQLILTALTILLAAPLAQAENFTLTSKDLGGQQLHVYFLLFFEPVFQF